MWVVFSGLRNSPPWKEKPSAERQAYDFEPSASDHETVADAYALHSWSAEPALGQEPKPETSQLKVLVS